MNIFGIGTDLVEHARLAAAISRHGQAFLDRLFTGEEQAYCHAHADPTPYFAARFAAKEAVAKAFGTGIGTSAAFREIEVIRHASGAPDIRFHGAAAAFVASHGIGRCFVSLSHSETHAIAYVILMSCGCGDDLAGECISPW